jgi:uncharacterized membrane protein
MKIHPITPKELWLAQTALFVAITLQITSSVIGPGLHFGPHYFIIGAEIALAIIIAVSGHRRHLNTGVIHQPLAFLLLALMSVANIVSFILVASQLITSQLHVSGLELLTSALAIFLTNIIVFAFWYWEIDSPGLSGSHWSRHDMDFQFTQQQPGKADDWQPAFIDYLYLSLTNGINFAPADALPLTHKAKTLMGVQALLSVFTLALILARSVSVLGQ